MVEKTQQALKNFYKQTLNIDVDGRIFGVKGLNWFKSNYSKLLSKPQEGFLIRVSSKEELKRKLAESMSYYDSFGSGQMSIFPVFIAPMVKLDSTRLSKETPPRYSETNVQVKGIDEPDIVKNDGLRIYFANNKPVLIRDEGVLVKTEIAVNVY